MKKNVVINSITFIVVFISIIMAYFLYMTLKEKEEFYSLEKSTYNYTYSLSDMKVIGNGEGDNQTSENEINRIDVIDVDFPFAEASIGSTAEDCSSIALSILSMYYSNENISKINEMEFGQLQYESSKIISGDINDFIVEITFNTRQLEDDANILKKYMKEYRNRPFLRTRFHIKATDEPYTYDLVEVGKNLGK